MNDVAERDADLDRPYEYRTFAIGDRVKVKTSPECRQPRARAGNRFLLGHFSRENGRTGTICEWPSSFGDVINGHSICIDFDEPFQLPSDESFQFPKGYIVDGAVFASCELELLEAADA
jgi:hypothetical protein